MGFEAFDYDIENKFGETDYQIDLFSEIEKAYNHQDSIFDTFSKDDIIFAFFPCIRFEAQILLWFRGDCYSQRNWDLTKKMQYDLKLHTELNNLYSLITKLVLVAEERGLRVIIENPYSEQHYLLRYWCLKPKIIDLDRSKMGDFWKKPTAYWFVNLEPKDNEIGKIEPKKRFKKRVNNTWD